MTIRKTISYGKAYKFVDHAAEHNPFADLEGTVLSKETLEMYFGEPSHFGFGVEGNIIRRLGWAIPDSWTYYVRREARAPGLARVCVAE